MNDHLRAVQSLLLDALEIEDAQERAAFLARSCGADLSLRQEVEDLITAQASAGQFLPDHPSTGAAEAALVGAAEEFGVASLPIQSAMVEQAGDRVGRYKLLQKIGEGGCGLVYMAEQETPVRRRVALKIIKLGMDTRNVVARFEAERQALALMDHPNIAKVLDAGATETGRPYFVMELVRGVKITRDRDEQRLSMRQRLELFIQVCQAVQHAHQKGIIHRDLKPSNILVTERDGQPVPKVIDFGIAKATGDLRLTDKTLFTAFEQFIGTPAYMSPEQARLGELDIDTRSDIYSLGVLLYELLTGKTPFETQALLAAGLDEMRRTIREKQPARPSTRLTTMAEAELTATAGFRGVEAAKLVHAVRGDLDWVIMKCLEKDRTRRYASANALADDVRRHLNNEPVVARPPSKLYEFQKTVRRHKVGFAATAAVIVALVLGVVATSWQAIRATRSEHEQTRLRREQTRLRQHAEAESYTSDMNLCYQEWNEGKLASARARLNAHIPQPGQPDLRGFEWRFLWNLCQDESLHSVKFEANDSVRRLAATPMHSFVAAAGEKTIRLLDPSTGAELARYPYPNPEAGNAWPVLALAAGKTNLLAAHRADGVIGLWDVASQKQLTTFQPFTNSVGVMALSPDGNYLAAADSDGYYGNMLAVWDISSPRQQPRLVWSYPTPIAISAMTISPDGQVLVIARDLGDEEVIDSFEVKTGLELKRIRNASRGVIRAVAFSPDGALLASGGVGGQIKVWNFHDRTFRNDFDGHPGELESLAFSADGAQLISAGSDGAIRRWDLTSRRADGLWRLPQNSQVSAVLAPDGKSIMSASREEVSIWSTAPRQPATVLNVPHGWSRQIVSRDSKNLIVSGMLHPAGPQQATVWDIASGRHKFDLVSKEINPCALAFSPNGRLFAMGSVEKEGLIGLWETAAWNNGASRYEPFAYLTNGFECASLSFSPDGRVLSASGLGFPAQGTGERSCATNRLAFWEVVTWKRLNLLPKAGAGATECAAAATVDFSSDGRLVAIGSRDGWVRLWDLKEGRMLIEFKEHTVVPSGIVVAFSPDNRWLASYSNNGPSLVLFDLADLEHMHAVPLITDEPAGMLGALFARDSKSLTTADGAGLITFWNLQTRSVALTLRHGRGPGGSLAMAPDGNALVSKDGNGVVKVWPAPSLEEIDRRRERR